MDVPENGKENTCTYLVLNLSEHIQRLFATGVHT